MPQSKVIGSLRRHAPVWRDMGADPLVLRAIEQGAFPFWDGEPPRQERTPRNARMSEEELAFTRKEVRRLWMVGATRRVRREELRMISKLRTAPKKGPKKFRLVINLRPTNGYCHYLPLKYEGLKDIVALLQLGWWLITADLAEGYFHVDVAEELIPFLGFEWEGEFYAYQVLPFGWSQSPWWFTTVMREPVKVWRRGGLIILMYLDDITLLAPTREEALRGRKILEETMVKLGLIREETKGAWEPTQRVEVLGLIIDTTTGTLEVPKDKLEKLHAGLKTVAAAEEMSPREVARTTGLLISVAKALSAARLYTRALYAHIKGAQEDRKLDWDRKRPVGTNVKRDAEWLANNLQRFNGKSMWSHKVSHILTTDASKLVGWSAVLGDKVAKGAWTGEWKNKHINEKELEAVRRGLQSFGWALQGANIQLQTDSSTALSYLVNEGGKFDHLTLVARHVWELSLSLGCQIVDIKWVPTDQNVADAPSREWDFHAWRIQDGIYHQLCQKWGTPDIDLMASEEGHRVPKFFSEWWTPSTAGVNALAYPWTGMLCWAEPPFAMITQILSHAIACEARLMLVVPDWPAAVWAPLLERVKVDQIYLGRAKEVVIKGACGEALPEPWKQDRRMVAVLLDGARIACKP